MEDIRMSTKERRRLEMLSRVKDGGITLKKSAELLSLSYRQMRRIFKRYREEGDQGLVHKGRGRISNRRISAEKKRAILDLYTQKYEDFGPTLAAEHLARRDGYVINPETLRQWLIKNGLWKRKRRRKKHRSWRKRKVHVGEMVQMDEVLCFEGRRQVQNDWTIHWKNRLFQLMKRSEVLGLVKQRITVREKLDGTIQLVHKGRLLKFEEIKERPAVKKSAAKPVVQKRTPHKPAPNHPWRRSWSRSYPQPQPDSDELGGAHSRRAAAGV